MLTDDLYFCNGFDVFDLVAATASCEAWSACTHDIAVWDFVKQRPMRRQLLDTLHKCNIAVLFRAIFIMLRKDVFLVYTSISSMFCGGLINHEDFKSKRGNSKLSNAAAFETGLESNFVSNSTHETIVRE